MSIKTIKNKVNPNTNDTIIVRKIGTCCNYIGCNESAKYYFKVEYSYLDDNETKISEYPYYLCTKHFHRYLNTNEVNALVTIDESERLGFYFTKNWYPRVNTNFLIKLKNKRPKINLPWRGTSKKEARKLLKRKEELESIQLGATIISIFMQDGSDAVNKFLNERELQLKENAAARLEVLNQIKNDNYEKHLD